MHQSVQVQNSFLLCALCRSICLFMAVAGGKRKTPAVSIFSCHLILLGSLSVNLEFIDLARVDKELQESPCIHTPTMALDSTARPDFGVRVGALNWGPHA